MKSLSSELRVLASECLKAFETAGVETSDHPVIAKAVKLCSAYVPQSTGYKDTTSSSVVSALWKEQAYTQVHLCWLLRTQRTWPPLTLERIW